MVRDFETIRNVLEKIETDVANAHEQLHFHSERSFEEFYHANLLYGAGYIEGYRDEGAGWRQLRVEGLTLKGHELLDKMRNDGVWTNVKGKIAEMGGKVPLRILEKLLDAGWDQLIK